MHTYFTLLVNSGGEGDGFHLWFIIFLLHGLLCVFSVMSDSYFDDPGFVPPVLLHHLHPHLGQLLLLFAASAG